MESTAITMLNEVLKWLEKEITPQNRESLNAFLMENCPEWKPLIDDAIDFGLPWALKKLDSLKYNILKECSKGSYTSFALKSFSRDLAARKMTKIAAEKVTKAVMKTGVAKGANKALANIVSKAATNGTVKAVAKIGSKVAVKAGPALVKAATPIGIVADVAQIGLEVEGHKKIGKTVGATGNMASMAIVGAVVGSPLGGPVGSTVGAGVGATVGLTLWAVGEGIGWLTDKIFSEKNKKNN